MVAIRFRKEESISPSPDLAWDTVWKQAEQTYDWILVPITTPNNYGGLMATQQINTSVLICLGTWRRAEPGDELGEDGEPYGWWGSSVDVQTALGERELGSRMWVLYRSILNQDVANKAIAYAREALQTLLDQGVVVSLDVSADWQSVQGVLILTITLYGQKGALIYKQQFQRAWIQNASSVGAQF